MNFGFHFGVIENRHPLRPSPIRFHFRTIMNYDIVYPDLIPIRWTLEMKEFFQSGKRIDEWAFTRGAFYDSEQPVPFFVVGDGTRVDYNPTAFSPIVISEALSRLIEEIAPNDVQLVDASIDGESGEWKVMNFLSLVDCIDHSRSKIRYCDLDDPYRPGKPRSVDRLVIDEKRAQGHHFFILQDWKVAIVSETMKDAIRKAGITGMTYGHRPVNLP